LAEQDSKDKAYEVKDKRRVNPDGSLREDAEPAAQEATEKPEQTAEEAEQPTFPEEGEQAKPGEEMPQVDLGSLAMAWFTALDLHDMLQLLAGVLGEKAWQAMGLRLAPGQKEPSRDMAKAKLAIDTIIFIEERMHSHLNDETRKALRGLISDLQLNFVRQGQ